MNSYSLMQTFYLERNQDLRVGVILLVAGWMFGLTNYLLGSFIGVCIGVYFLGTFMYELFMGEREANRSPNIPNQIQPTSSAPLTDEPTIAERINAIHIKNDFKCPSC